MKKKNPTWTTLDAMFTNHSPKFRSILSTVLNVQCNCTQLHTLNSSKVAVIHAVFLQVGS